MLRSYAERIVRLKGEIKGLQGDVKDVKSEAASMGFDKKALDVVVARMLEDETARAARLETEGLAEVYLASLGMLDGTPLGDATRRRADSPPPPPPPSGEDAKGDDETDGEGHDEGTSAPGEDGEAGNDQEPPTGAMSQDLIDAARVEGEEAAAAGSKVFANPYVAGDPRRAAWDEGWCRRTGSDGMDLPSAFRRKPKSPPSGPEKRSGEDQ
ncbi:DUF2312 domain-containing protein [Methylobacterium sp. W2]|nr:DUF2312 domain-containing protein [Methylobacterium sp. W2]